MKTLADRFDYLGQLFMDFDSDENRVEMNIPSITNDDSCGTLACNGGYAWLFHLLGVLPIGEKFSESLKGEIERRYKEEYFGSFSYGERVINEFLFNSKFKLDYWANDNPKLWGNKHGMVLFCNKRAFGKRGNKALTLKDIGRRYKAVAKRLRND